MTSNYEGARDLLDARFPAVNGSDFYREIFPDNENSGELSTDFSRPNAVYLYQGEKGKMRRRIMLNDTWEQDYIDYVEQNPMTLCSGLTYRGRTNKLEHAQRMNALIFDLDGVGARELESLFYRFGGEPERLRRLPMPTFLALSGNGLHIYYVFEQPIDLFPNIKLQLKALKYDLTFRIWEYKATSQEKAIQYQSINQGFRMVGSVNAKYDTEVKAYRTGERVTLDYVNAYARPENRVNISQPFRPSKVSREQAAQLYPDWYQRVVVEGNKRPKKWDIKGKQGYALYDWWLRQMNDIKGGHRYFYLMCLAIYACKCDVPKAKLRRDMQEAFEDLKRIPHENPLTEADITSALEAYSKDYYNFTLSDIEYLTELHIKRNRRNTPARDLNSTHQAYRRGIKKLKIELGENTQWNKGGRPSAEQTVREYVAAHPNGRKAECIRATGLSKPTVYKWWK